MNDALYLCKVDADYLKYLHKTDSRVRVKFNNRPYVGVFIMMNSSKYVIPLTSKTTQERAKQGKKKRAARVTTFIRDSNGIEIANLLHNNMIPVIDGCFEKLNINASEDTFESNEIRFIRKNMDRIIQKACKVHDDRISRPDVYLINICCDFEALEKARDRYSIHKHEK